MSRFVKSLHAAYAALAGVPKGVPVVDAAPVSLSVVASEVDRPRNLAVQAGTATPFGTGEDGVRTSVTFMPMKALHEMKPYERLSAMKTSRFIVNRLGIGGALVEGCSRYSIGDGLIAYSATGDKEYDDAADKFVDGFLESNALDVRRELNAYEMQEVICPGMMTDGDCGAAKILPRDASGKVAGQPQIQLFTGDQIGDAGPVMFGSRWQQGIERDAVGGALTYRVLKEARPGVVNDRRWWDYRAQDFMHIIDPKRINQGRGIPWMHRGHNSCLTMLDLKELEEKAAYLNSFFSGVITTPTGEAPEGMEAIIEKRKRTKTREKADGTLETVTDIRKYAEFLGGAGMLVLKEGEQWNPVKNERPSLTFTGFMDWLVNDIAWGFGVPPSFVWAIMGRTGPETRLTLSQADWFFRFIMRRMVSRFCKPLRDWILLYGLVTGRLNNGRMPRNGADYRMARWHGPKKITIDERYFYKTWLDRLEQGMGTEEEFYAEQGKEASVQRRKRAMEVKDWQDLSEEFGVPYERLVRGKPGQGAGASAGAGGNGAENSAGDGAKETARNVLRLAHADPDAYEIVAGVVNEVMQDPEKAEQMRRRLKAA